MPSKRDLPEETIVKLYVEGRSLRDLSKLYCIDKGAIKSRLLANNVVLRTLSEANRIYSVNETIFENIDSHEKAYWLGFITSDGSIYRDSLRIGLSSKDYNHLEKFRNFMESSHPIKTCYPIVKGKKYESCEISITSNNLLVDLARLDVFPNKSKTVQPAPISKEFYNSYILGMIDGDGCFHIDSTGQAKLNIISSLAMCQFIMDILVHECKITPTKIIEEKRSPGMNYCYFGGNLKVKKIVDFLYKDSDTYLDRKFNIVNTHFWINHTTFAECRDRMKL